MKILKTLRLFFAAAMIGFSCIFPIPIKDEPPKFSTELRETKEDEDLED